MLNKERKIITNDTNSKISSVDKIVKAGIPDEHVEDILEMREILTYYDFSKPKRNQIIAQPTVEAMIKAYHEADDDLDILEVIVETALSNVHSSHPDPGVLNAVLFSAVEKFKEGGLDALDE